MSDMGTDRAPDVIDEVLNDHEQIKWLLDQVTTQTGDRRTEIFGQLANYLAMHESAEQRVIHPQMERLDDEVAEERLEEESKGDQMLERLRSMGVDDPEFDSLFAKFRESVLRHAHQEEQQEHPKLREAVAEQRLTEMAGEFLSAEQEAAIGNRD
jgi:hemerythrin superfamily protein